MTLEDKFWRYRQDADQIEERFYLDQSGITRESLVQRTYEQYLASSSEYVRVALLRLLCGEVAILEACGLHSSAIPKAADCYLDLYEIAWYDPLSLLSCGIFFVDDVGQVDIGLPMLLRAAFVAEATRAYVLHVHQSLARACCKCGMFGIAATSVRRVAEYYPDKRAPDSGFDRDIREIAIAANVPGSVIETIELRSAQ